MSTEQKPKMFFLYAVTAALGAALLFPAPAESGPIRKMFQRRQAKKQQQVVQPPFTPYPTCMPGQPGCNTPLPATGAPTLAPGGPQRITGKGALTGPPPRVVAVQQAPAPVQAVTVPVANKTDQKPTKTTEPKEPTLSDAIEALEEARAALVSAEAAVERASLAERRAAAIEAERLAARIRVIELERNNELEDLRSQQQSLSIKAGNLPQVPTEAGEQ